MNNDTITIGVDSTAGNQIPQPSGLYVAMIGIDSHVEVLLHEDFNQLKARMMNLAECAVGDTRQCNALKGLMKDALNQAYFGSLRRVKRMLEDRGVTDGCHSDGPTRGLSANSLSDILVD